MDFQKKDWQFRDLIAEYELNRMEDGIEEGITKAEQAQQTADGASIAAANAQDDIDAHLASSTPHTTVKGVNLLGFSQVEPIQISDGAISVTRTFHVIDTEGGASTDELENINGGGLHDILILQLANVNRKITIKNAASQEIGNIRTFDGTDIVLDRHYASVLLIKRNAQGDWAAFPVGVKRSGDTMTGDLYFDGVDRAIRNARNDRLFFVTGGQGQNVANGSYIRLEGIDYGGVGAGGDIHLRTPPGKKAMVNSNEIWHAGNLPYETGIWTPELQFGGSSTGILYSVQIGRYTLVGNVVNCEVEIELANKGSQTGVARIVGLPFASSPIAPRRGFVFGRVTNVNFPPNAITMNGVVTSSSTAITLDFTINNDTFTQATNDHFSSSSILRAAFQYWKA